MTHLIKNVTTTTLVALLLCTAFAGTAHANPSLVTTVSTAAATSSVVYMTPGTATTTLSLDAGSGTYDSAFLNLQYQASTSANVLRMRIEHSSDNVDWYPDTITNTGDALNLNATSTQLIGDAATYKWAVATTSATTDGFPGSGSATRSMLSMTVFTPTRYTRVIFWNRAGEGNGALWAAITAKKQTP